MRDYMHDLRELRDATVTRLPLADELEPDELPSVRETLVYVALLAAIAMFIVALFLLG